MRVPASNLSPDRVILNRLLPTSSESRANSGVRMAFRNSFRALPAEACHSLPFLLRYSAVTDTIAAVLDFREVILARLKAADVTRYRLAQRLRGSVPERTLYDYLAGKTDTTTKVLAAIFEALEI